MIRVFEECTEVLIDLCLTQELTKLSNIIVIAIISRQVTISDHETINITPTVEAKYSPVTRGVILVKYLSGLKIN